MKAGYATMMPSGKRTRCATAIIDTVMHRFPPALSPAKHTRSPVQPEYYKRARGRVRAKKVQDTSSIITLQTVYRNTEVMLITKIIIAISLRTRKDVTRQRY